MSDSIENPFRLMWDLPQPHVINVAASTDDADGYGHINNGVYLRWLDRCVWDHCNAVQMPPSECKRLNRGFAVVRHEIDYILSAYPGDELRVANWVTLNDGRLKAMRQFQIIRISDGKTILRAKSSYVCTNLTSGMAARMPEKFRECFSVLSMVSESIEGHVP